MKVRTAGKLGYCFGVSQAIEKAVQYAKENGPLYTLGTLAHNEVVVEYLKKHRVLPVTMDLIKKNDNVAITAHGTPPETYTRLQDLGCKVLDCTCPIVHQAQKAVSTRLKGFDIIIFGDPAHQEVIGLNGWAKGVTSLPAGAKFVGDFRDLFTANQGFKDLNLSRKIGIVSQTTKIPSQFADFTTTIINRHIEKLDEIKVINTICPIVTQRIEDTKKLAVEVDIMLVVGSQESANTKNLALVAHSVMAQRPVERVLDEGDISIALKSAFRMVDWEDVSIGITAGTSTPIEVVNKVVEVVQKVGTKVEEKIYGSNNNHQHEE